MELTATDIQTIVNAVLSAIRTNSKSIEQLTPANAVQFTDMFEINGARSVSIQQLISSLQLISQEKLDSLLAPYYRKINEILTFLNGVPDDKNLVQLLADLDKNDLFEVRIVQHPVKGLAQLQLKLKGGSSIACDMPAADENLDGILTARMFNKFTEAYETASELKDSIALKQDALTFGKGLAFGDNTLSVQVPITLISDAEIDEAVEKGVYITDGIRMSSRLLAVSTSIMKITAHVKEFDVTQHSFSTDGAMVRHGHATSSPVIVPGGSRYTVVWEEWQTLGTGDGTSANLTEFNRRLSALEQGIVAEVPELTPDDVESLYAGLE